ncbi:MAG: hypothetical protein EZS28_014490 [Streblomastix strix]|uniref:Uncharacterized protein n=1 Tax=Streblomastix strix TaxID=222440 RepID=A0A5J4W652_9EUKA|nr:MAG: hypothetical protein EZS28_014490 [Streblomastix strix]
MGLILIYRQQQVYYSRREHSDTVSGKVDDEKQRHVINRKNRCISHGPRMEEGRELLIGFLDKMNISEEIQKMLIKRQQFNIQMKYLLTMGNGIGLHNYVVTNYICYFEPLDQLAEIWEDMGL